MAKPWKHKPIQRSPGLDHRLLKEKSPELEPRKTEFQRSPGLDRRNLKFPLGKGWVSRLKPAVEAGLTPGVRAPRLGRPVVPKPPKPLSERFRKRPTREELLKQTFVVNPENPYVTYYAPIGGSFGFIAKHHMTHLPYVGWNVRWVVLEQMVHWRMAYPSRIGVVHPTLYPFLGMPSVGYLKLREQHEKVAGFEVADSDTISERGINLVNEVDLLMVPSQCSKDAYVNSGCKTRVEVVPHGLSDLYNTPKNPLPQIPREGVKVLYFQVHSERRKGGDVVLDVMRRILRERRDVRFVVRTGRNRRLCDMPQTTPIRNILPDRDVVHLYDSCDILLSPSRGGGFELNVLEAMARGLVVIASSWPAIKEYAEVALFIKDKGRVRVLPGNPVHVGMGSNPDPSHAYELLKYAIDNLAELKGKAERLAPKIRERYTWRNTAKRIGECLNTL